MPYERLDLKLKFFGRQQKKSRISPTLDFYQSICTVGTGRNFRFVKQIADIVCEENLLPTIAIAIVIRHQVQRLAR